MKTKMRLIGPILIGLVILSAVAGGFWYWYDNNVDRSGWVEKKGVRYYRDFHADPVSGWLDIEGETYYFHDDGTPHFDWQTIDGVNYYFEEDGSMTTGWLELESDTYYLDDTGAMVTGWQKLEEATYYFGTDGRMHTGWLEENGKTHYFGGNGTLVEGWLWLEEGRYYMQDGAMVTGWLELEDSRYHFGEDGLMASGFSQIEGDTYYFDSEGVMATGVTLIEHQVYNFQDSGVMFTGWEETEEGTRYYLEDGTMAVGWFDIDGQKYFFNEDGLQQFAGWLEVGEYRYYIKEDGNYAVGPTVIDGQTHYFTPKGIEVVLVNAINPVPDYFEQNLVDIEGKFKVDQRCYDALVKMLDDCEAAGAQYIFNSGYRTLDEQITILEYRTLQHMKDYELSFSDGRDMALDTVAIPGTSEHHLGLAVDILGGAAIEWLTKHCWEYGFIVRYTEEKEPITGIVDEPWHFRYVGTEVSLDMKDSGLCLEEYLGAPAVTQNKILEIHGNKWYEETFYMLTEETIALYIGEEDAAA